jgi:hypothetical protein
MHVVFVELPPFERHRDAYLSEDAFRSLQELLIQQPDAGARIPGTAGLRKLRLSDERRGIGKRGGLRVIYYWWAPGPECWLFTIYAKNETRDLTPSERRAFTQLLKAELESRRTQ